MKSFKISMLATLILCPLMSLASGPNVLYSFQVQSQNNGYVKACITTYAGWGESDLVCSSPVLRDNQDLNKIQLMNLASQDLQVGYLQEGFAVDKLLESLTVLNCATNSHATAAIQQKKAQILKLQKEIRAIEQNADQRSCQ